jgi:hypothetical protein
LHRDSALVVVAGNTAFGKPVVLDWVDLIPGLACLLFFTNAE